MLAWPKATSLLVLKLAHKGRHKGSLRLPRMLWQGHLACQQPHRLEGLAGSIGSAAGSAPKHPMPLQAQACLASSICQQLPFPEPASPASQLLGLGGCRHAKGPCQSILGHLREPLSLSLRASLGTSRLVAFGQASGTLGGSRGRKQRADQKSSDLKLACLSYPECQLWPNSKF